MEVPQLEQGGGVREAVSTLPDKDDLNHHHQPAFEGKIEEIVGNVAPSIETNPEQQVYGELDDAIPAPPILLVAPQGGGGGGGGGGNEAAALEEEEEEMEIDDDALNDDAEEEDDGATAAAASIEGQGTEMEEEFPVLTSSGRVSAAPKKFIPPEEDKDAEEVKAKKKAQKQAAAAKKKAAAAAAAKGKRKSKNGQAKEEKDVKLPLPPPDMEQDDFDLLTLTSERWIRGMRCGPPPPKFRRLKQNLYRDQSLRPNRDTQSQVLCSCKPQTGCDENCMNRQLFMECLMGKCPTLRGEEKFCANMVIQQRSFAGTEVFKTSERGWALRTTQQVKRGTLIIEYMGEVTTMDEVQRRTSEYTGDHDFYFACLEGPLVLDAGPMGSDARFANHSCAPNCALQKWTVAGEPHIILVAQRDLDKGEEILYNYGVDGVEALFGQQECRCGARNCSGYIGKKAVGSGLAPSEEWLGRAQRALETKNTSLEIIETLVKEAPETNTCRLYLELKSKSEAVRAWLNRYYEMMKGWVESEQEREERLEQEKRKEEEDKKRREEERKKKAAIRAKEKAEKKKAEKAAEKGKAGKGGKGGKKGQSKGKGKGAAATGPAATTSTDTPAPPALGPMGMDVKKEEGVNGDPTQELGSTAAVEEVPLAPPVKRAVERKMVEYEDLADLVTAIPKDIRFPEGTEARQLFVRARQAKNNLKFFFQEVIKDYPKSAPAPAPPKKDAPKNGRGSLVSAVDEVTETKQEPIINGRGPANAEDPLASTTPMEEVMQFDSMATAGATDSIMEVASTTIDANGGGPSSQSIAQSLTSNNGSVSDTESTGLNSAAFTDKEESQKAGGVLAPDAPVEFLPVSCSMKEIIQLLRETLDCVPIRLRGLNNLIKLLKVIDEWAKEACTQLGISKAIKAEGEGADEVSKRPRKKFREIDVSILLRDLFEAYGDVEGDVIVWKNLPTLDEGLAEMVEMVISREDAKEQQKAAAESKEEELLRQQQEEEEKQQAAAAAASASMDEATMMLIDELSVASSRTRRNNTKLVKPDGVPPRVRTKKVNDASGRPPVILRCLCQLPEHESKMRTMVECEACEEWYHPHCVNMAIKEMKNMEDFICPSCRHLKGLPSGLACPTPPSRFVNKATRPTINQVKALFENSKQLPVYQFDAIAFLGCLVDACEKWKVRARNALIEYDAEACADLVEEEKKKTQGDDAAAGDAKTEDTTAAIVPSSTADAPPQSPSAKRVREAKGILLIGGLVCEHRLLELTICDQLAKRLRSYLWRTISPLCLGEGLEEGDAMTTMHTSPSKSLLTRKKQLALRPSLEMLSNVVEEGIRLRLQSTPEFIALTRVRDETVHWLQRAETMRFHDLAGLKLGPPSMDRYLDLHGEWGYARARAAVLQALKARGLIGPLAAGRPPISVEGGKVWVVDRDPEPEQHCLCRGPESGEMVNCDGCHEWFHFDCVGYVPEKKKKKPAAKKSKGGEITAGGGPEQENGDQSYSCIACSEGTGRPYKYTWMTATCKKLGSRVRPMPAMAGGGSAAPAAKRPKMASSMPGQQVVHAPQFHQHHQQQPLPPPMPVMPTPQQQQQQQQYAFAMAYAGIMQQQQQLQQQGGQQQPLHQQQQQQQPLPNLPFLPHMMMHPNLIPQGGMTQPMMPPGPGQPQQAPSHQQIPHPPQQQKAMAGPPTAPSVPPTMMMMPPTSSSTTATATPADIGGGGVSNNSHMSSGLQ